MTNYYPAFINLCGKQCVVVGGGKVAERKVLTLLDSGAAVKVISPALTDVLEKQKDKGRIRHIRRNYRSGDLKGAFLVIAATSDERINRKVSDDAPCLVNVVDKPEMANFIVPSVVDRGPMTIAVSTSGASPAIARAVRKELELLYNKDFGQFLDFLKKLRKRAIKEITDKKARERFLKGVASKEVLSILRGKGFKEAKEKVINKIQGSIKL
ncbi:MAG: bifunctional precorrin-2 dehydrogenase/sirohydrochlorin ferrochelatase [Nitrospiraceae bacterium]|nr:bifunctional precorrin-2 dehydrogenase/sirohydrochlorin ferrochelatase [Nitrospiraceae bacterium]